VILKDILYNITMHIKNSIDIQINICYFEIKCERFSQTGDTFVVCLHNCPSVGISRVLIAHFPLQCIILIKNAQLRIGHTWTGYHIPDAGSLGG
jgi:hypothetical protein